jgi:hypothetical protein
MGARISIAALTLALVAGCEASPGAQVRAADAKPDDTRDTTHVTVFRNPSGTPNIVLFCADRFRFAALVSDRGSLTRLPEDDAVCGGEPK